MKLTVAIPVMGQLEDTKPAWGCHLATIADKANTELLVIDNGSTDGTQEFLTRFIFPHFPDHRLIHHDDNQGVIASMNEAWREATGNVIAILHNDVFIFEQGWDQRVLRAFEGDERLGLAGFLGGQGIAANGGRMHVASNLLEAESHGARETGDRRVATFDGLALIGRRAMFQEAGGFDTGYTYHHFYDRDISVASHLAGWHNLMIGVSCHHRSGVTANRPEYQAWIDRKMGTTNFTGDKASYDASERYFLDKYKEVLPIIL